MRLARQHQNLGWSNRSVTVAERGIYAASLSELSKRVKISATISHFTR